MWHIYTRTHTHITDVQTNTHKQDFYLYKNYILHYIVCDWECWGRCVSWVTVLLYDWLLQHPPLEHCRVGMCRRIFWCAWSSPSLLGSPDPLSLQQDSMPTVEPAGETPHLPNSQKHATDGKHCLTQVMMCMANGRKSPIDMPSGLCVCMGPWVGVKALQKSFIHSYAC